VTWACSFYVGVQLNIEVGSTWALHSLLDRCMEVAQADACTSKRSLVHTHACMGACSRGSLRFDCIILDKSTLACSYYLRTSLSEQRTGTWKHTHSATAHSHTWSTTQQWQHKQLVPFQWSAPKYTVSTHTGPPPLCLLNWVVWWVGLLAELKVFAALGANAGAANERRMKVSRATRGRACGFKSTVPLSAQLCRTGSTISAPNPVLYRLRTKPSEMLCNTPLLTHPMHVTKEERTVSREVAMCSKRAYKGVRRI